MYNTLMNNKGNIGLSQCLIYGFNTTVLSYSCYQTEVMSETF